MVSKQLVEHHNFQRDKQLSANKTHIQSPGVLAFQGLFYVRFVHWNARNDRNRGGDWFRSNLIAFELMSVIADITQRGVYYL